MSSQNVVSAQRPWILIPIYDHGSTIAAVVDEISGSVDLPCLIVDDGSGMETKAVLAEVEARHERVTVHYLPVNCGKGVALRTGFAVARAAGASHVIHLDADGQHEIADVPRFVAELNERPAGLLLGKPIFDDSVPRSRLYARQLSRGIVWLCTLSFAIDDPLCGFRAVPLDATLEILERESLGDRMEFEPGLAVALYWNGVEVRNIETRVRYLPDGVSHFDNIRDTLRMARLYGRLLLRMIPKIPVLLRGRRSFTTEAQRTQRWQ